MRETDRVNRAFRSAAVLLAATWLGRVRGVGLGGRARRAGHRKCRIRNPDPIEQPG